MSARSAKHSSFIGRRLLTRVHQQLLQELFVGMLREIPKPTNCFAFLSFHRKVPRNNVQGWCISTSPCFSSNWKMLLMCACCYSKLHSQVENREQDQPSQFEWHHGSHDCWGNASIALQSFVWMNIMHVWWWQNLLQSCNFFSCIYHIDRICFAFDQSQTIVALHGFNYNPSHVAVPCKNGIKPKKQD